MAVGRISMATGFALLLLFGSLDSAQAAAAIKFKTVLHDLAAVHSVDVAFTETRRLAVFDKPVVLHGRLIYRKPDFLEKRITSPIRQRFILNGDRVTLTDAQGQARTISLDMAPGLSGIVGAYRALLRGDRKALEFDYWTSFNAEGTHWRLELEPKNNMLKKVLKHVIIRGTSGRITLIDTEQANGDRSTMRLQTSPQPGNG